MSFGNRILDLFSTGTIYIIILAIFIVGFSASWIHGKLRNDRYNKEHPPDPAQKAAWDKAYKFPWAVVIIPLIIIIIIWQVSSNGGPSKILNDLFGGGTPTTGGGGSNPSSTTGGLFISISGGNGPYDIYVNGSLKGKNSVTLTGLATGSYRVTAYNRSGTVVHDAMSTVSAGRQSVVKVSGVW